MIFFLLPYQVVLMKRSRFFFCAGGGIYTTYALFIECFWMGTNKYTAYNTTFHFWSGALVVQLHGWTAVRW